MKRITKKRVMALLPALALAAGLCTSMTVSAQGMQKKVHYCHGDRRKREEAHGNDYD